MRSYSTDCLKIYRKSVLHLLNPVARCVLANKLKVFQDQPRWMSTVLEAVFWVTGLCKNDVTAQLIRLIKVNQVIIIVIVTVIIYYFIYKTVSLILHCYQLFIGGYYFPFCKTTNRTPIIVLNQLIDFVSFLYIKKKLYPFTKAHILKKVL